MNNNNLESSKSWNLIFFAWFVATIATLGSLFFSEVMEFPPCILCWYQRILMYPLVIILLIGLFPLDKNVFKYSIPFAVLGWLIAFYHNLLQYGLVSKTITPCAKGIPCSTKYIDLFGFISIPMLSLIAFTIILTLLLLFFKRKKS